MEPVRDAHASFEPLSASVSAARAFVAAELERAQLDDLSWPVLQAVSELATNCVLHAQTPFTVAVSVLSDGAVRIEVTDASTAVPRQRHYGDDATTGRGVALIAGLARSWGVEARDGGKVVWCEIAEDPLARLGGTDGGDEVDLDAFLPADERDPIDGLDGGGPHVSAVRMVAAAWRDLLSRQRVAA